MRYEQGKSGMSALTPSAIPPQRFASVVADPLVLFSILEAQSYISKSGTYICIFQCIGFRVYEAKKKSKMYGKLNDNP